MQPDTIITVHTDEGIRTAIVTAVGPRYASMVWIDDRKPGVRVNKIPHQELRFETLDYPLAKAKRTYRKAGRSLGITKSARRALRA